MAVHESDVCIIGGGISSAMLAQRLSELRSGLSITVVEAGRSIFDFENRRRYRDRMIRYGENPWPGDFIEDQSATGIVSRTMAVGGSALHWGGTCNRFSEEDLRLRSMYGLYVDWPIECLPTCVSASSPAKFEPFTYASYMAWYQDQNYARDSADGVRIQAY